MKQILLTNALITTGTYSKTGALAIEGERISGICLRREGETSDSGAVSRFPDAEVIDLKGNILLAGGIDAHVHFREPGLTAKADISSESKAALLGGVTSFVDMPNTNPPTTTPEALEEKLRLAGGRSWTNYGFHLGATNSNCRAVKDFLRDGGGSRFGGIKVFMGSSTGNMLVDEEDTLRELFQIKGKTVLVHCEDEATIKANLRQIEETGEEVIPFICHPKVRSRLACIKSTAKALEMAIENGTRLHLLHVSTAEEVEMVRAAKIHNPLITAETSPNYLWFSDEDYDTLEGRLKCNPAVKSARDREALRQGLAEGIIDTLGTDHAPHLREEKDKPYLYCPSGLPSIQFFLPVAFSVTQGLSAGCRGADEEKIPLTRLTSAYSEKIAGMLGIRGRGSLEVGNFADLVVLDPDARTDVSAEKTVSKCGWSPYEGASLRGSVRMVFLNGEMVVSDGEVIGEPKGRELVFDR